MATPSQFDKFGLTLVHTIVNVHIRPVVLFGAIGIQAGDLAIALIEQDAAAASALPDTNFADDQPGRGWIYKARHVIEDHTTAGAVMSTVRVQERLKSKRKIGDMELLLLMSNFSIGGTNFSLKYSGFIRQYFLR